jgi:hypothetical protein
MPHHTTTLLIPVPQGEPTMRDEDDPIRYTIDEDTIKLLEAVLNNSETLADCQWDADSADDIRLLNRELGERFGIEYTNLEIEESEDGDGNLTLTIKEQREADDRGHFRPKLIVDNDTDGFPDNDN